jgi:hypothetical protein
MGKSILEEAVEDVQALKRAAEENAKNLLVEAMSPRIKDFIQSHLGQEGVEAPGGQADGGPSGNSDTAPDSQDQADGSSEDDEGYETGDDEDEVDFDVDADEDEDEDLEDDEESEEEDEEEEDEEEAITKPAKSKKGVKEASDDSDDESDEDDEDSMDEEVEITSEDLKRAFLESIKGKSHPGSFSDAQDPNDGEYGLAHKVPGEVMWADGAKVLRKAKKAKMVTKEQHEKVVQKLHRQLAQYQEAFKYLKKNLNEMNLFNAKLIYTTKLLQNNSLSNKQKLNVVETLDNARSKRECEFMYKTLSESFKIAGVLGEGRTKVKGPKASRMMKPGATLNEGKTQESAQSNRWAELAGLTE